MRLSSPVLRLAALFTAGIIFFAAATFDVAQDTKPKLPPEKRGPTPASHGAVDGQAPVTNPLPPAATRPAPATPITPEERPVPEPARVRLLTSYQRYLLYRMNAESAKVAADRANDKLGDVAKDYNATAAAVAKDEHYPEGTQFNINVDTGKVTVGAVVPVAPAPASK